MCCLQEKKTVHSCSHSSSENWLSLKEEQYVQPLFSPSSSLQSCLYFQAMWLADIPDSIKTTTRFPKMGAKMCKKDLSTVLLNCLQVQIVFRGWLLHDQWRLHRKLELASSPTCPCAQEDQTTEMFSKDAPFRRLQEKILVLLILPWQPNCTVAVLINKTTLTPPSPPPPPPHPSPQGIDHLPQLNCWCSKTHEL